MIFYKSDRSESRTARGFVVPLVMVVIALIVLVGGVFYSAIMRQAPADERGVSHDGTMTQKEDGGQMMKKDADDMMEKKGDDMMSGEKYFGAVLAGSSAPLLDFKKADYDAALKTNKLIVLYFYANWCPICKAEFPIMQTVFNELVTDYVIGFRVNYNDDQTDDDEKNLAREFGVAYQHTKVLVKNGRRILKSPEGWDDKRYNTEINKATTPTD